MTASRKSGSAPPWSVLVAAGEVPEAGQHFDLVADERVRAAAAGTAGVNGIVSLKASFDLVRHGRDGVRVTGEVQAEVEQTCVVTLEPVRNTVHEPVDLLFVPPEQAAEQAADDHEDEHGPAAQDAPEALVDGAVDLGALAVEFLTLAIDPYPRKPGVAFDRAPAPDDPADRPFAALAALKGPPRGGSH
jgi:uncharacterized metal-binding protein YceD (DUF177 family)